MEYSIYLFVLIIAFLGVLFWAFGRKRKGRFKKDSIIPFNDRER